MLPLELRFNVAKTFWSSHLNLKLRMNSRFSRQFRHYSKHNWVVNTGTCSENWYICIIIVVFHLEELLTCRCIIFMELVVARPLYVQFQIKCRM